MRSGQAPMVDLPKIDCSRGSVLRSHLELTAP